MDKQTEQLLYRFAYSEESDEDISELKKRMQGFLEDVKKVEIPKGRAKQKYGQLLSTHILRIGSNPGTKKKPEAIKRAAAEIMVKLMDEEYLTYSSAAKVTAETLGFHTDTVKKIYSDSAFTLRTREWMSHCGRVNLFRAAKFMNWLHANEVYPIEVNKKLSIDSIAHGSVVLVNEVLGPNDCGHYPIAFVDVESIKWDPSTEEPMNEIVMKNILNQKAKADEIDELVSYLHYLTASMLFSSNINATDVNGNIKKFCIPYPESSASVAIMVAFLNRLEPLVCPSL